MPSVDVVIDEKRLETPRVRQIEAIFDVPPEAAQRLSWQADVPLESRPWNVGLIVGPSGSGKSTVARHLYPKEIDWAASWTDKSVIDDVAADKPVSDIATTFSSVGFNTIPAWRRPYAVLSTGEKFRVELARRLLEQADPIVVDEFTSVVDRQVAKIGSHAVQKYVRKHKRRFVAVTCHHDVEDWLQPDWVLEPSTMAFRWRCLQRRPAITGEIFRVQQEAWRLFAPFHYLTASLNKAAQCYVLAVEGHPANFTAVNHMPHPSVNDIKAIHRTVTLPDWQGLGLAFVVADALGAALKTIGKRLRSYPSHPALVRSMDKSAVWRMTKRPGTYQNRSAKSTVKSVGKQRACGVFEYIGPAMKDHQAAIQLTSATTIRRL